MDIYEFEQLLDAKLQPLSEAIIKLEKSQEKIIEVITVQARQDEILKHLVGKTDSIGNDLDIIYTRLRTVESTTASYSNFTRDMITLSETVSEIQKDSSNRMWDILKIFAAAIVAGLIGLMTGRGWK